MKLRKKLLDGFDKGEYKALVAMKCLNEGVDVPSTDKVIIMSSSPNPAEYVQRRGRVLRKSPGKTHADIYDLIEVSFFQHIYVKTIFQLHLGNKRCKKYLLHNNSTSLKSNKRLAGCFQMLSHLCLIKLFIMNYDFLYILQLREITQILQI